MSPEQLRRLLEQVKGGELQIPAAVAQLQTLPFQDIGVATIDHHRALRQGCPEVIFGEGKDVEQLLAISQALIDAEQPLLITRLAADKAEALQQHFPTLRYAARARVARLEHAPAPRRPCGPVAVMCAGTSDMPVAEEAAETLDALGFELCKIYDVGVAGLHRLLGRSDELASCSAVIVIAGMEGALPSVVGGLVAQPIIAVPTSVGYGTALAGFTALLSMLTSCASGITVVNIDNGFGAAMAIHRILPRATPAAQSHSDQG